MKRLLGSKLAKSIMIFHNAEGVEQTVFKVQIDYSLSILFNTFGVVERCSIFSRVSRRAIQV
jgi:hypothetical protein